MSLIGLSFIADVTEKIIQVVSIGKFVFVAKSDTDWKNLFVIKMKDGQLILGRGLGCVIGFFCIVWLLTLLRKFI